MIPVCVPLLNGKELEYVENCVRTNWISSRGEYVDAFEKRFSEYCGVKHGITTSNGTASLHLALASIGLKEGDEVIVPAFTMISSVFSIVYCGAKPVLVDSESETLNMDPNQIEEKIRKNEPGEEGTAKKHSGVSGFSTTQNNIQAKNEIQKTVFEIAVGGVSSLEQYGEAA